MRIDSNFKNGIVDIEQTYEQMANCFNSMDDSVDTNIALDTLDRLSGIFSGLKDRANNRMSIISNEVASALQSGRDVDPELEALGNRLSNLHFDKMELQIQSKAKAIKTLVRKAVHFDQAAGAQARPSRIQELRRMSEAELVKTPEFEQSLINMGAKFIGEDGFGSRVSFGDNNLSIDEFVGISGLFQEDAGEVFEDGEAKATAEVKDVAVGKAGESDYLSGLKAASDHEIWYDPKKDIGGYKIKHSDFNSFLQSRKAEGLPVQIIGGRGHGTSGEAAQTGAVDSVIPLKEGYEPWHIDIVPATYPDLVASLLDEDQLSIIPDNEVDDFYLERLQGIVDETQILLKPELYRNAFRKLKPGGTLVVDDNLDRYGFHLEKTFRKFLSQGLSGNEAMEKTKEEMGKFDSNCRSRLIEIAESSGFVLVENALKDTSRTEVRSRKFVFIKP